MLSRVVAGGVLVLAAAITWLAVAFVPAARVLQAAIAFSMLYVAYLAWRGYRVMRRPMPARTREAARPWVTVVVPAANEAAVIADVVGDVVAQDYADDAGPRFDLVVVDDGSTDATARVARDAGAPLGARLAVLSRPAGSVPATKGAVLAHADPYVRGEVLAVVDADARLRSDFLEAAMAAWELDPGAAALQAQRRADNHASGWLVRAQDEELLMDMASQCGRWATDGTAELRGSGMLVRTVTLREVGGWSATALTEDLELSTRLATAGHRIALAPRAEAREEAVERVPALWRQRMRWAEGSMRRLLELGPRLVTDRGLPFKRKLDFLLFVTEFLVPPLFVASILVSALLALGPAAADWTVPASLFLGYGIGTLLLALAGLAAHGERGFRLVGRAVRGSLFLSHWLIVVPVALARIALLPPTRDFARTSRRRAGPA